jgi:hypothetical protein
LADNYFQFPNFNGFALFFISTCSSFLSSSFRSLTYFGLASTFVAHRANLLNASSSIYYLSLILLIFFKMIISTSLEINLNDRLTPENKNIYLSRIWGRFIKIICCFCLRTSDCITFICAIYFVLPCSVFDKLNKWFLPNFGWIPSLGSSLIVSGLIFLDFSLSFASFFCSWLLQALSWVAYWDCFFNRTRLLTKVSRFYLHALLMNIW